jgi:hypothetical protein
VIVLLRVVTLGDNPAGLSSRGTAIDADASTGRATVSEASGQRASSNTSVTLTSTVATELGIGVDERALILEFSDHAGERGRMTIWRRFDTGREAAPWLQFEARVRDDGTISIAGLAAGHYDLTLELGDGNTARHARGENVEVPGRLRLDVMAPAPGR